MQEFKDIDGGLRLEIADSVDSEGDLRLQIDFDKYYFDEYFFDAETAKKMAVAIYAAAGGNDEGPIMASTISFNEGVIRLAAIHNKTVEFRYVKGPSSAPELRRFVPTSVAGAGDSLRFVGRDPDRDDEFRSYRLDRIKGTVGVSA